MSVTSIATLTTMLQSLPDMMQDRVIEHVREYITTLLDEEQWTMQFENSQNKLIEAAHRAKQEIAAGKATDFDQNRL